MPYDFTGDPRRHLWRPKAWSRPRRPHVKFGWPLIIIAQTDKQIERQWPATSPNKKKRTNGGNGTEALSPFFTIF